MPQLEYTNYISQLFWLAITFGVLYIFMARVTLPQIAEVIEKRQSKIDNDMDAAERLKNESQQVMLDYETKLGEARAQAQHDVSKTEEELAEYVRQKQQELSEKLNQRLTAAEKDIAAGRERAMNNVRDIASSVASSVVDKFSKNHVHQKTVEGTVDDILSES